MVVRSNMNAMNANRNLSKNNHMVGKAIEKLVSGYDLNRAADDASGLAVSERMRSQITRLDQGTSNAIEGVGLIQTAEGAMTEIHDMLNRLVELATKAANGTISDEVDREAIQAEVDVLNFEIERIVESTNFNGIPLLKGTDLETIQHVQSTVNKIVTGTEMYIENVKVDESKSTKTTDYNFCEVSGGVSSVSNISSTTDYYSDTITLATDSTYVKSDVDLPYTISMEIVTYDETNSTVGSGSLIYKNLVSITVEDDGSGGITVSGNITKTNSSGTSTSSTIDYTNLYYNTIWDSDLTNPDSINYPSNGYDYVSYDPTGTSGYFLTTTEVQVIMSELLGHGSDLCLDVYAGGIQSIATPTEADWPELYTNGIGPNYPYIDPTNPNLGRKNASYYVSGSTLGVSTTSIDGYGYVYKDGMRIISDTDNGYLGYTNDGRVLGVVSTVTSNGIDIYSVGSPTNFDTTAWYSGVDVNSAAPGEILGITTVGESYRTEVTIKPPITQAEAESMSISDLLNNYVFSVSKTELDSTKDEEDQTLTFSYITVWLPFNNTSLINGLESTGVTIIYGDPSTQEEHEVIDALSNQMSNDLCNVYSSGKYSYTTDPNDPSYVNYFDPNAANYVDYDDSLSSSYDMRVNRKVDDVKYDVPTDSNVSNLYTLQIGTYRQVEYSYTDIFEDVEMERDVYSDAYTFEYSYEDIDDRIILHVADQN